MYKSSVKASYFEKYPEKRLAKNKISRMKKKEGHHHHHWSYLEEHFTDVIELEKKDHYFLHRFIKYDQERKMYRCSVSSGNFLAGELLDSKERHEMYFNYLKQSHA